MGKSYKKKNLILFFRGKLIFTIFIAVVMSISLFGKITVVEPAKDEIKLSEFITGSSTLTLSQFYTSKGISKADLPKIFAIDGEKSLLGMANKNKVFIIDPFKKETIKILDFIIS